MKTRLGVTIYLTLVGVLIASVLVVATVVLGPGIALADPAGPTDYETTITSVERAVDGIELRMLGGDSFIELTVDGREVVVTGYRGEPYLWFRADGIVSENRRSESTYLNEDRYGEAEIPAAADPFQASGFSGDTIRTRPSSARMCSVPV